MRENAGLASTEIMLGFKSPNAHGTAFVVGADGQDGFYLINSLLQDDIEIARLGRKYAELPSVQMKKNFSILDSGAVLSLLSKFGPAQIYYLAAHHRSSEAPIETISASWAQSHAVHIQGLINFLDAMVSKSPDSRLFYAASSHVFGNPTIAPQNEETPFLPTNVYGITKATGIQLCRLYRRKHGLRCSVGILFNHESPRRSTSYVGRKIVRAAVEIRNGRQDHLVLGDLNAKIDWGAAQDYVEAMRLILDLKTSDEFVVASGELHSIGEFVDVAFGWVGLDPTKYVRIDNKLITKSQQLYPLVGDASKLVQLTGWKRKYSFEEIIHSMVEQEQVGGLD